MRVSSDGGSSAVLGPRVIGPRQAALRLPVRLDFGMAAASDSPPLVGDLPASAVTVPVHLTSARPFTVTATPISEPRILFESHNSGAVWCNDRQVAPPAEFALHLSTVRFLARACLGFDDVPELLAQLGHGLRVETETPVAEGSGLGVSTMLAAGVLACTATAMGYRPTRAWLVRSVIDLETDIGGSGGWEDVMALFPGLSFNRTLPNDPADIMRTTAVLPDEVWARLQREVMIFGAVERDRSKGFFTAFIERYRKGDTLTAQRYTRTNNALNERLWTCLTTGGATAVELGTVFAAQRVAWMTATGGESVPPAYADFAACLGDSIHGWRPAGAGGGGCLLVAVGEDQRDVVLARARAWAPAVTAYDWSPVLAFDR